LNHGKEVGGELVVACGDTAKVLQPGEEALDQVALSIELLAEAWLPAPVCTENPFRVDGALESPKLAE
jgi:hypothetical protein